MCQSYLRLITDSKVTEILTLSYLMPVHPTARRFLGAFYFLSRRTSMHHVQVLYASFRIHADDGGVPGGVILTFQPTECR
jgi:hypothetical protein